MLFYVVLALMFFFYNRSLKKHIILLSKCTSRLANKRIHIKLVSSECIDTNFIFAGKKTKNKKTKTQNIRLVGSSLCGIQGGIRIIY